MLTILSTTNRFKETVINLSQQALWSASGKKLLASTHSPSYLGLPVYTKNVIIFSTLYVDKDNANTGIIIAVIVICLSLIVACIVIRKALNQKGDDDEDEDVEENEGIPSKANAYQTTLKA